MSGVVERLNWGCGDWVEPGWVNSDVKEGLGIIGADIREGLPFEDERFDYVVSIHALPELQLGELVPALRELRRVLKPHGVFDSACRIWSGRFTLTLRVTAPTS